jgi:hypothetical protein
MDKLTISNPSSNGTTSTDKRNRKNLTVAVQLLPHAGGDKSARRAATPYLPYLLLKLFIFLSRPLA